MNLKIAIFVTNFILLHCERLMIRDIAAVQTPTTQPIIVGSTDTFMCTLKVCKRVDTYSIKKDTKHNCFDKGLEIIFDFTDGNNILKLGGFLMPMNGTGAENNILSTEDYKKAEKSKFCRLFSRY